MLVSACCHLLPLLHVLFGLLATSADWQHSTPQHVSLRNRWCSARCGTAALGTGLGPHDTHWYMISNIWLASCLRVSSNTAILAFTARRRGSGYLMMDSGVLHCRFSTAAAASWALQLPLLTAR